MIANYVFVALSYTIARLSHRRRVRPSVCHTLVMTEGSCSFRRHVPQGV